MRRFPDLGTAFCLQSVAPPTLQCHTRRREVAEERMLADWL